MVDSDPSDQYLRSFYWAYQTITTVGFGDINVKGDILEMVICIIWMIFGVGY